MIPEKLGYAEVAYGAELNKIVPKSIPGFWFTGNNSVYVRQMKSFIDGNLKPTSEFYMKDGINKNDALTHLTSIVNSFLLTKREKLATCSFLSSQWFKYVNI